MWGAVKAGIKASGKLDLAAAVAAKGANARGNVYEEPGGGGAGDGGAEASGGHGRARGRVLVNAGNANCATGQPGIDACVQTCVAAAESFGCIFDEVFPSSTGIIGVPFPAEKVIAALPELKAELGTTPEHAETFARAIMTTDTKMKVARAVGGCRWGGGADLWCGEGCGDDSSAAGSAGGRLMRRCWFICSRIWWRMSEELRELLEPAVERSFNSISIDGDTSTNDTVLLLASGASGVKLDARTQEAFADALKLVCGSLAYQIVDDGEGVGHVVTLHVTGARTEAEAKQIAKAIAHSPLCKTAWSSGDPNWGRLLAAAGYSGVAFDPALVTILRSGPQPVFELGVRSPAFQKRRRMRRCRHGSTRSRWTLGWVRRSADF